MDCASRITFLRSIWFRIVHRLAWVLSGTIPHRSSVPFALCLAPSKSVLQRFLKWWQSDKSGILEHECFVGVILHPSGGEPCWQDNFTASGTRLAFPKGVLGTYWLCAQEERPPRWLKAGDVPGLVLLLGKTWWLPIIQNILIMSSGYFLWDADFWMTVLIFIYVFLSFLNVSFTSSCEIEIQCLFIYLFVLFCFSQLLWANFISAALWAAMTFDSKQFNCKNAETEKHQTRPPKTYDKTNFAVPMTTW